MGMIGRWIDERCKAEPEVMRRVLNRSWGDLGSFFGRDGKCGCMVGSWAIESDRRGTYDTEEDGLAEMVGFKVDHFRDHFILAWRPQTEPSESRVAVAQRKAVRILKQRIRKSLGIAPENRPVQHLESVSR